MPESGGENPSGDDRSSAKHPARPIPNLEAVPRLSCAWTGKLRQAEGVWLSNMFRIPPTLQHCSDPYVYSQDSALLRSDVTMSSIPLRCQPVLQIPSNAHICHRFLYRLVCWSTGKGALNLLYAALTDTPSGVFVSSCEIRECDFPSMSCFWVADWKRKGTGRGLGPRRARGLEIKHGMI